MLSIDFSCFSDYAEKLDKLGASLQDTIGGAMEKAGKTVEQDTLKALENPYLPAKGKYTTGDTKASVIRDSKVKWSGTQGTLDMGFDKTRPGAGGFLITGTPKMAPDAELAKIFSQKNYETKIRKQIKEDLQKEIDRRMG